MSKQARMELIEFARNYDTSGGGMPRMLVARGIDIPPLELRGLADVDTWLAQFTDGVLMMDETETEWASLRNLYTANKGVLGALAFGPQGCIEVLFMLTLLALDEYKRGEKT